MYLKLEVLIGKTVAIDGLSASAVTLGEVTTYIHDEERDSK
jgi:hypothetical protein